MRYRKILSPLLLKTATLHRHAESFNDVADRLLDQWEHTENGLITNLEGDLYCYFVQVKYLNDIYLIQKTNKILKTHNYRA